MGAVSQPTQSPEVRARIAQLDHDAVPWKQRLQDRERAYQREYATSRTASETADRIEKTLQQGDPVHLASYASNMLGDYRRARQTQADAMTRGLGIAFEVRQIKERLDTIAKQRAALNRGI